MRLSLIILFVLGFAACRSRPSSSASSTTVTSALPIVSYELIKQDILSHHIQSTVDLLHFFAQEPAYQELLSSAILERQSGALHHNEVTPEFPRVVMGAGTLSLHFTANPSLPGSQLIEVIELPLNEKSYKFHLINFALSNKPEMFFEDPTRSNPDKKLLQSLLDLYGATTGGHVVNCTSCHISGSASVPSEASAPNWNPNFNLFRVYGYQQGKITQGSEEFTDFQKFLRTQKDPTAGVIYRQLDLRFEQDADGNIQFTGQPVAAFTDHVFALARRKLVSTMRDFSQYPRYQYMMAGALMDCAPIRDFIPPESLQVHETMLKKAENSSANFSLEVSGIEPGEVRPEFWNSHDPKNPEQPLITESLFLDFTTLSVDQALGIEIRENLQASQSMELPYVPVLNLKTYQMSLNEFSDKAYISRLAKLKYIFRPYYPEIPSLFYAAVNEVFSIGNPPDLIPQSSDRIEGANRGLDLIQEEFGQRFLQDNPPLDLFSQHHLKSSELLTAPEKYCALLKDASRKGFSESPLKSAVQP